MARSKEFDENVVLDKAMKLFWEQGYAQTSMNDLVEHMGIHRRSLYDTFTDKHTLYLKALDRFGERITGRWASGIKGAGTAEDAMRFIFDFVIKGEDDSPPGCFFVNSAVELAHADKEVDAKTVDECAQTERILQNVVTRGQKSGEFSESGDPKALAEYLYIVITGLRVMTRTSTPEDKLFRIAEQSMQMLKR
ncbi:TetR/AcrR family transcriptional regulator [Paenibacillus daejeonensis]|uniref:TetR/AcrR family transcriptional regulator n=1 Tax=Paenibacillus daejeonensis TaxID=135193 RepID=UPI000363A236|nr:TetR/AcrR family transcriptional regulator [Paenibacillus daejeonensis]